MPSLNLKTGKINYAKADLNALQAALTLLKSMSAHDAAAKSDADAAASHLSLLKTHVQRQRKEPTPPAK